MKIQQYKNKLTHEQTQLEMESELIGIHPNFFKRDRETIFSIYKALFLETKNIPKFGDIEQRVAQINYDICYRVSVLEFEVYYEQDAVGSMLDAYNCSSICELDKYINISSVLSSEIDFLTQEMFNDLCAIRTAEIEECIKEALDSLEVVYEDDTDYNPLSSEILFDKDQHIIVVNDAQITMFPEIHAEEYGYNNNVRYDDIQNISNYSMRRRRTLPSSRLIESGV